MSLWVTFPLDWRRSEAVKTYDLYWRSESKYGKVHPSPSLDEIPSFYDIPYYTHESKPQDAARANANKQPLSFLTKLRQHRAWRFDHGKLKSVPWWKGVLGASPLCI
jgi:hypothetical protein